MRLLAFHSISFLIHRYFSSKEISSRQVSLRDWSRSTGTKQFIIVFPFTQETEEAIRFYRNIRKTDVHQLETLEELAKLKQAAAYDGVEALQRSSLRWADFKTQHARKAIIIGTTLMALATFDVSPEMTSRVMRAIGFDSFFHWLVPIVQMLGIGVAMALVDVLW